MGRRPRRRGQPFWRGGALLALLLAGQVGVPSAAQQERSPELRSLAEVDAEGDVTGIDYSGVGGESVGQHAGSRTFDSIRGLQEVNQDQGVVDISADGGAAEADKAGAAPAGTKKGTQAGGGTAAAQPKKPADNVDGVADEVPAPGAGKPKQPGTQTKPKQPKPPANEDGVAEDIPAPDGSDAGDDTTVDDTADDTAPSPTPGSRKGGSTKGRPKGDQDGWKKHPAVEITVTSYDDDANPSCRADSTNCNLRAAIEEVGAKRGTIYLPTVEVHKLRRGPILLPQYSHLTLTSIGTMAQKKAVIYHRETSNFGGGNSAILVVPENTTLTLDQVAFKNNPKRAVYGDRGSHIVITGCSFVNNTFDTEGACVKVDMGYLDVNQTLFYNNSCQSAGGSIYTTYSHVNITSTNFLNNTAASGAGLKVYQSILTLSLSHFSGGNANSDGGALEAVECNGTVTDSNFEMNQASSGGAVKMAGSNLTFSGIQFYKNLCRNTGAVFDTYLSNATILNSIFRRNHAMNIGGVFNGFETKYFVYASELEMNYAESSGGVASMLSKAEFYDQGSKYHNNSAFYGGVISAEEGSKVHLKGSTLLGNNVTGNGAAVRIKLGSVFLEDVYAINNTVIGEGGSAIFGEGGELKTYLGVFTNHTSPQAPVLEVHNTTTLLNSTIFQFNVAKKYAGVMWVENSEFLAYNTTFWRNKGNKGGAIFLRNQLTDADQETPNFRPRHVMFVDCTFKENIALDAGGAIEMSLADNVTSIGGIFLQNNASDFGGAVHMESSNASYRKTRFEKNRAQFGAAIETFLSEFHLDGAEVVGNQAGWGGALEFKMSVFKCMGDTQMIKNQAKYDGAAVNCQNSTVEMSHCVVAENEAANNAGGLWLDGSAFTATDTVFRHNKANSRDGGGVFALSTASILRSCTFDANSGRRGANFYNHGGDASVYCLQIDNTYNKPKVGGHITQDCYTCPTGQWGDFQSATSPVCKKECGITHDAKPCFDCPYEPACMGRRVCDDGYTGEQCMFCAGSMCKLGDQCLSPFLVAALGAWSALVSVLLFVYLLAGPVLDANQFTRVKILVSLLQLLIMTGRIHAAFKGPAAVVLTWLLKPMALWMDMSPLQCMLTRFTSVAADRQMVEVAVVLANVFLPLILVLILVQWQDRLYKQRLYYTNSDVARALSYLKSERRIGQFALLAAELSYIPLLWNASRFFYCYPTTEGKFLMFLPLNPCKGTMYMIVRGVTISVFTIVGVAFPLGLRYVIIKLHQRNMFYNLETRQMYRAIYESYEYQRSLFDITLLMFRALLLVPMLAAHPGFVQAMVMMSITAVYYFYYRNNSPFIKFEDPTDIERPNLHYKAEESKIALLMFMLVVAAIGAKARDISEICGWVFAIINALVLALVIRNFFMGVKRINVPPSEDEIIKAQTASEIDMLGKKQQQKSLSRAGSPVNGEAKSAEPSLASSSSYANSSSRQPSRPESRAASRISSRVSSPVSTTASMVHGRSPSPPHVTLPRVGGHGEQEGH